MTANHLPGSIQSREQEARKLMLFAGTMYGLIFGLSFAILTWGQDGMLLASSAADDAWTKLLLGLPLAVAIGGLTGRLAAMSPSAAVPVVLWAVTGGLLGVIAGHIPFDGGNLVAWIADRRLWGEVILPFGHAATVRTTVVVFTNTVLGAAMGFGQSLAVQWSWNRATRDGKMSVGSWVVLLICIPLALPQVAIISEFFNRPLRTPQQRLGELIELTAAGKIEEAEDRQSDYRSIKPFHQSFSERYVTYFVAFGSDTGTWYSAYVDIAFDNGFVLRCVTSGKDVIYCDDFSKKFAAWMGDLVHAGLYDERRWLEERMQRLAVDDAVAAWLSGHRDHLSENYEVSRVGQQGGLVFMSARFDTGFEIVCRFRGATPVLVDQCVEASASLQ